MSYSFLLPAILLFLLPACAGQTPAAGDPGQAPAAEVTLRVSPHVWERGESIELEQDSRLWQWADPPIWFQGETDPPDTNKVRGITHLRLTARGPRRFTCEVLEVHGFKVEYEPTGPPWQEIIGLEAILYLDEQGIVRRAAGAEANEYVKGMGGIEAWLNELQVYFIPIPEEEPHPGLRWDRSSTFVSHEPNTEALFQTTEWFTYRGVESDGDSEFDVIDVETSVWTRSASFVEGDSMIVELEGVMEGRYRVEPGTWRLISYKWAGRMDGTTRFGPVELPTHWEQQLEIRRRPHTLRP